MEVWALVISLVSVLIAGGALWISKAANDLAKTIFEREKEKEKPKLINTHIDGADCFNFLIADYSANKNLRIDKVEVITPEHKNYINISFHTKYNDAAKPPQMEVVTEDSFNPLEAYTFKIYTNFDEILEHSQGSIFSTEKPDEL